MDMRDFAYSLNKALSEGISGLEFNVDKDNHGVYGIYVSLPQNIKPVFHKEKCYIGMDDLDDKVELYSKYGDAGYVNFGRFIDPQRAFLAIEKYLYDIFGDAIERQDDLDFYFSSELQDFLSYNNISSRTYKQGQPHLILNHPNHPITYFINFSEYNGRVLVEIEEATISDQNKDLPFYFENDYERVYKSDLSYKNQQKVFAEILTILKKEGF